ncbi:MAG TPA: hypothetical protein VLY46_16810 [Usitatibacter sp.]|nr:hypothetical protein [Usitatibacter sp.]
MSSAIKNSLLAALLALVACGTQSSSRSGPTSADGWHDFEGSWIATGSVRTIKLGDTRQASVADLRGTLELAGASRPAVGFRGDAIALSDSESGMVGRAAWTDEHGDQVFSEIRGGGPSKGSHVTGTFIGGTGRYRGATGTYEFTWEYVLAAEDGTVQGRAVGLKGRVHVGAGEPGDKAR